MYMKIVFFASLIPLFASCSQMPSLFQAIEDIQTQESVRVVVDKDAVNQNSDLEVNVNLKNKDQ